MFQDFTFNPIGAHAEDTSVDSVTTLAPESGATKLLIQAFLQNVRFTLDESNPDANTGFQLKAGDPPMVIPIKAGQDIKVISETNGAIVQYQWGN